MVSVNDWIPLIYLVKVTLSEKADMIVQEKKQSREGLGYFCGNFKVIDGNSLNDGKFQWVVVGLQLLNQKIFIKI